MGMLSDWKKIDEIASWDLDRGCRKYFGPLNDRDRRLKKILTRQARRRINRFFLKRELIANF